MIRLLIVEDHAVCADGLAALLGGRDGIEVVGVAGDERRAGELISTLVPDVVLCDVMLGGCDRGLALLRRYGRGCRFILFSAFDYPAHQARAVRDGAAGYLPRSSDADAIAAAVRRVSTGAVVFPPEVMASVRAAPREPTERERELLVMLARGATNEELAGRMDLRIKSVEGMLRRLFDRYRVENRTQLAWYALSQGWLTGEPNIRINRHAGAARVMRPLAATGRS
jgi:DNA-binding NarL/FixJ family response regulator